MTLVINGKLPLSKHPTLDELQPLYEQTMRKRTWYSCSSKLTFWSKFLGGDRDPNDVFRSDVKAGEDHLKTLSLKESTIKQYISVGSGWWDWMAAHGVTPDNPFHMYRRMKKYVYIADDPSMRNSILT